MPQMRARLLLPSDSKPRNGFSICSWQSCFDAELSQESWVEVAPEGLTQQKPVKGSGRRILARQPNRQLRVKPILADGCRSMRNHRYKSRVPSIGQTLHLPFFDYRLLSMPALINLTGVNVRKIISVFFP